MNKITALLIAALMLGSAAAAYADESGSACAKVYATVNPNIAVVPGTPIVNAGTIQTGDFTATIDFRVDANLEQVCFFVEASPLYKGDDPNGTEVLPIDLNLSAGVVIQPTNANPLGSGSNVACYTGGATFIDAFPAQRTGTICFESSQNGHFSQDVFVTVTWTQDDNEKPTGEYSGKVRLNVLLTPNGEPAGS